MIDMSFEEFEDLVAQALERVPVELARMVDNVVIVVEEHSPPGDELFGLYEGVPLTSRGSTYVAAMPDRISIYRRPILRACRTREEVVTQVVVTVVHEIAHHFGIDDHRLHELGWG
ncbi:MAG: metallopeptidase family protein [Actinobacteria bacterium]|nr:metallopeptidase family protein [Actinomycetota bacterium]